MTPGLITVFLESNWASMYMQENLFKVSVACEKKSIKQCQENI